MEIGERGRRQRSRSGFALEFEEAAYQKNETCYTAAASCLPATKLRAIVTHRLPTVELQGTTRLAEE